MIITTAVVVVETEPSCLKRKKNIKNETITTLRPIKISELCIEHNTEMNTRYDNLFIINNLVNNI